MIKNPKFGKHPDLFGGDTPIVIPIEQLSRDEQLSLKRLNLTTEELNEIENTDEELYRAIIENSPEEQSLATEKCVLLINRAVENELSSAKVYKDFAEHIRKGINVKIQDASESELKNPNNWTLRVVDSSSNEKCDYDIDLDAIKVKVDLKEFNLTDWEIEDVAYEVQRKDRRIDEVDDKNQELIFYIIIPYKILADFRPREKATTDIDRYLASSLT